MGRMSSSGGGGPPARAPVFRHGHVVLTPPIVVLLRGHFTLVTSCAELEPERNAKMAEAYHGLRLCARHLSQSTRNETFESPVTIIFM